MSGAGLQLVQELVDRDRAGKEVSKEDLYTIRGTLLKVQVELKQAAAANKDRIKVLEHLTAKCQESAIAQTYLELDIEEMKNTDLNGANQLDLVDVDTFLRDNPECTIPQENVKEFMMARYKDEEQRRARLFLQRVELEKEIKALGPRIKDLREALGAPPHAKRLYNLLNEKFRDIDRAMRPRALFPDGFPEDVDMRE